MKKISWQVKTFCVKTVFLVSFIENSLSAQTECKEIKKEIEKLEKLQKKIEERIKKNEEILASIKKEKEELEVFKKRLDEEILKLQSERFKRLAKDFESMDPEFAGEKLSMMEDAKIAAYILYNMNPRKAGEALNYVSPKMVSKISKILTQLKNGKK